MNVQLEKAIARLSAKADGLSSAVTLEQSLEDDRAAIKADAIKRVMEREKIAATNAEKIVETDEQYFLHREKQRSAIVARYKADAEYWAAKAQVTQASLVTPDAFALDAELKEAQVHIESLLHANRLLYDAKNEWANRARLAETALADANKALENSVETIP